jgi:putative ABC transport system ATP-binding protein
VVDVAGFTLAQGEQTALAGESGSGKTTFLNLLAGLLTPDSGEILLDGVLVNGLPEGQRDSFRARQVGYVFQTFNLLQGLTALENVEVVTRLAGRPDRRRSGELLDRVGLDGWKGHYPRQLSVGQQQRVAVARALVNRPSLVLADEPTGNLDPRRALESLELLRTACRECGSALLLVSHDAKILSRFDRVEPFERLNRAGRKEQGKVIP